MFAQAVLVLSNFANKFAISVATGFTKASFASEDVKLVLAGC